MTVLSDTDRLAKGDLVIRRDQRHRYAGVRYWVRFAAEQTDTVTVIREDRQGSWEVIPMSDLMRVSDPLRRPS